MKSSELKKSTGEVSAAAGAARSKPNAAVAKERRIVQSPYKRGSIPLAVIRRAVADAVARHKK
jgi:hypothetical protein